MKKKLPAILVLILSVVVLVSVLIITGSMGRINGNVVIVPEEIRNRPEQTEPPEPEQFPENTGDAVSPDVNEPEPTPESTPEPTPEPTPEADQYTYEDRIASVYSHTNNSAPERMDNIRLAIEKLDGTRIMPGEVFSFNEALGPVTEENGFKDAQIYFDNGRYPEDEVYELGGGVNQVASTIYCASLYGVLDPVERYPHHFWLSGDGYLKRGRDAYVCNNGVGETKDLKIKNSFADPVKLKIWRDEDGGSDKLYVEIWGTNPDNLRGEPYYETYSYYLKAKPDVCDRYETRNYRKVTGSGGYTRDDDLNFDYDGDGTVDYDIYYWHESDYVWT